MAYVNEINVQGTTYDINDKRLPETNGVVSLNAGFEANSIVEKMSGYSFTQINDVEWSPIYAGIVKNGNKLTFVIFGSLTTTEANQYIFSDLGYFSIPSAVANKLYPYTLGDDSRVLDRKAVVFTKDDVTADVTGQDAILKVDSVKLYNRLTITIPNTGSYFFRIEATFLLSDNLVQ